MAQREGAIQMVTGDIPPPGYRTQSPDTSYRAEKMLFDHWRSLAPREKAALVRSLCRSLHRLQIAGLRVRHPDAGEQELLERAACSRLGPELFERVTGKRFERP